MGINRYLNLMSEDSFLSKFVRKKEEPKSVVTSTTKTVIGRKTNNELPNKPIPRPILKPTMKESTTKKYPAPSKPRKTETNTRYSFNRYEEDDCSCNSHEDDYPCDDNPIVDMAIGAVIEDVFSSSDDCLCGSSDNSSNDFSCGSSDDSSDSFF